MALENTVNNLRVLQTIGNDKKVSCFLRITLLIGYYQVKIIGSVALFLAREQGR
jgi:hypothetical protein